MVYQYYIVEIKRLTNGEYEHNVQWAWDADKDLARRKAESKAFELLAVAAVSETILHSVTVLSDDGGLVMNRCYNNVQPQEGE